MAKQPKVTLYGTETCIWCAKTREFFKDNKIKYKEIDVGNNKKQADIMIKKSKQHSVPVIEIDGEIMLGFDKDKIKKMLSIK